MKLKMSVTELNNLIKKYVYRINLQLLKDVEYKKGSLLSV